MPPVGCGALGGLDTRRCRRVGQVCSPRLSSTHQALTAIIIPGIAVLRSLQMGQARDWKLRADERRLRCKLRAEQLTARLARSGSGGFLAYRYKLRRRQRADSEGPLSRPPGGSPSVRSALPPPPPHISPSAACQL